MTRIYYREDGHIFCDKPVMKIKILMKIFSFMLITSAVSGCMTGCGNKSNPVIELEIEGYGIMTFELYPEYAPATVKNFVELVDSGFYDGTFFHRIVKGFMIQGGDPDGNGTGGSDRTIKGEFSENGFKKNTLKHTKGVISMARSLDMNSASSQFFVIHGDSAQHLDGKYAAFGNLISGQEVLDAIASIPVSVNAMTGERSVPQEKAVVKAARVISK